MLHDLPALHGSGFQSQVQQASDRAAVCRFVLFLPAVGAAVGSCGEEGGNERSFDGRNHDVRLLAGKVNYEKQNHVSSHRSICRLSGGHDHYGHVHFAALWVERFLCRIRRMAHRVDADPLHAEAA